jgi:hypothetical protein
MPYQDDMTEDNSRWFPPEGWVNLEVVKMEEGFSKANNPKFTIYFVSAGDTSKGLTQDLTNIQGKRWLLRQLLEACGIEPDINEEGKKIYTWDIPDVEGKSISGRIVHEKSSFIDREGNERDSLKAKIVEFKKLSV